MNARADRSAPLFWLLFSAGGTASAMLMPGLVVITGIAVPAGWVTQEQLLAIIANPITRLVLVGLVSLSLFHWAHRFRYALVDLGFGRIGGQAWFFYGTAAVGTAIAVVAALRL